MLHINSIQIKTVDMKRHGSYYITCSKNTLLVKCIGSWNLETTRLYSLEFKATVAPLINDHWAAIFDMRNWELATPESMPVFQNLMQWCIERGMTSCIYVYEQSFIKKHNIEQMTHYLERRPHNFSDTQMTDLELAYDWLRSHEHEVNINDLLTLDEQTNRHNVATLSHMAN